MATEGSASQKALLDPNVILPPAVKRAAQRSEDLSAQAKTMREARPPGADDPVRVEQPPANPPSGVVISSFDPKNPALPDPTTNSPTSTPPNPEWEHQLNSMKGRYDRSESENRRMANQIADMQRLFASMPVAPPSAPTSPQAPPSSGVQFSGPITGQQTKRRLSQKEIDEYTPELLDVVGRRAQEVIEPALQGIYNQLEQKLGQLHTQLGGVRGAVAYNAQERMYEELRKEVPGWEQINEMPEWHDWLKYTDPMTGIVRQNILTHAHQNSQTGQVVATFKRFIAEQGIGSAPAIPSNPSVSLMSLAAPGRAKEGQFSVQSDKPTYSPAQIKAFFHDKTFGKYAGREAEAATIEADILRAPTEGRIRY